MPLNIKYSIKLEEQRIEKTLKKLPWYNKLGYRPRFPENINPRVDNLKKIKTVLKNEYDEKDYRKAEKEILTKFSKVEKDFYDGLKNICDKKLKKNIK